MTTVTHAANRRFFVCADFAHTSRRMSHPTLRILSVIPPMTQLNTPYPSTAYLTGFLRARNFSAHQVDLALALVLELFSPVGLTAMRERIQATTAPRTPPRHLVFDRHC